MMNLKYGIYYFSLTLIFGVLLMYTLLLVNQTSDTDLSQVSPIEAETESIAANESKILNPSTEIVEEEELKEGYLLKQYGEFVMVYLYDGKTVFEHTSILVDDLDTQMQADLISGIYIKTTKELYAFLENYSS